MDVPQDNPAGRLHRVLSEVKEHAANQPIETCLTEVLGLDEDESAVLLHQYVAVMATWPGDARSQTQLLPDQNHALYLRWVPKVEAAMTWAGRWAHTVNNMQNEYDDSTLYALEITADLLHRFKPEPVLDEDKLLDLIAMVREIIDEISDDTNLSPSARAFLVDHLQAVLQALEHFRIVGYAGVEEAMDRFLGATFRTPEARNQRTHGWIARIWSGITQAMTGTKQLGDSASSVMKAIETGKDLFGG